MISSVFPLDSSSLGNSSLRMGICFHSAFNKCFRISVGGSGRAELIGRNINIYPRALPVVGHDQTACCLNFLYDSLLVTTVHSVVIFLAVPTPVWILEDDLIECMSTLTSTPVFI